MLIHAINDHTIYTFSVSLGFKRLSQDFLLWQTQKTEDYKRKYFEYFLLFAEFLFVLQNGYKTIVKKVERGLSWGYITEMWLESFSEVQKV